ncbi:BCL2/adenovirus E1B 19 kDa protein-interacting protein 2 isoform X1 [Protobothrops mucrosquamatus]|uniref:BCL2/adenovirus E1B 19 kDa protein-interacting protein 2 isoform X1 n=1 Tax=Protobothrops mucrosquamatus TaxID=103944 RepID=UPI000775600F|nr:BCL2/adenovirus E1B 19 kDa protein-interacting protein 2 isoform X1 [Protobothrops mucrosquamatus]
MEGVEVKEEWQDEDFPRPLPEDDHIEAMSGPAERGDQSEINGNKVKKKLIAPNINLTLDQSEESILSGLEASGDIDLDDIDTPSENSNNEFEWEDDLPKQKSSDAVRKGSLLEYTASEEKEEERRWRMYQIGDQGHRVDMRAIEPYKKVISHGGYYGDGLNAIIVFAVCFMPESSQPNYRYLMDNLFKYVIGSLELLIAESYMIVYLNGATTRRKMPSLGWLRKCYQQIDRRLRKNLKSLIIVHPSWFIRTLLAITKPFISSKFSQKIRYVFTLAELAELIPMDSVTIPECIKRYEEEKFKKKLQRIDQELNGKQEQTSEQ